MGKKSQSTQAQSEDHVRYGKAERTRDWICKNAMSQFRKKGFEAVTMRELAEACDLSLGAFYYHYKSKEEIVLEIFNASLEGHVARTEAYLGNSPQKLEKIMEWICRDRFVEFQNDRSMLKVLAQRIDPEDPISPWNKNSKKIRLESALLFQKVVSKCFPQLDPNSSRLLAQALWLHHLVLLGYWAFDQSKKYEKTEKVLTQAIGFWKLLPIVIKVPGVKSLFSSLFSPLVQMIDSEEL